MSPRRSWRRSTWNSLPLPVGCRGEFGHSPVHGCGATRIERYRAGVEPSDSDIKAQLLISPPERWQQLWSAVDELLAEQPSPWEIRTQNADGSLCMPYAVYSDAVGHVQR